MLNWETTNLLIGYQVFRANKGGQTMPHNIYNIGKEKVKIIEFIILHLSLETTILLYDNLYPAVMAMFFLP